jgi:hypothetical protein
MFHRYDHRNGYPQSVPICDDWFQAGLPNAEHAVLRGVLDGRHRRPQDNP